MKASTTSGLKGALLLGIFFIFVSPTHALAAVQFTEVMYDAPGADTGREWLEVTNVGQSSVDITGYKLFESGVNHGITVVEGTTSLAVGESAVIAANTQKFLTDYPAYAGTLFKSSFSLTNTGESVALKDKTLATVSSLTYYSSMGAAGDGNSLHVSASGASVPGAPNPGSSAPTKAIVKEAPVAPTPTPAAKAVKTSPAKKTFSSSNTAHTDQINPQGTISEAGRAPLIPNIPEKWFYLLGLVALVSLGVGAVLYVRQVPALAREETLTESDEFDIE